MKILSIMQTLFCALLVLSRGQDQCEFNPLQNNSEYQQFTSKMIMAQFPNAVIGYQFQIAGVNENGTVYLIGGTYQYGEGAAGNPMSWSWKLNVYDSWIAYDDTIEQNDTTLIQSGWSFILDIMPDSVPDGYGFTCAFGDCSTYVNNKLYIINPTFIDPSLVGSPWNKMIIFDMHESIEACVPETNYSRNLPFNYYTTGSTGTGEFDMLKLGGDGW
eukprot:895661_1